jgi:hypothetical protein
VLHRHEKSAGKHPAKTMRHLFPNDKAERTPLLLHPLMSSSTLTLLHPLQQLSVKSRHVEWEGSRHKVV